MYDRDNPPRLPASSFKPGVYDPGPDPLAALCGIPSPSRTE